MKGTAMTTLISKATQTGKILVIDHVAGEFVARVDGSEVARHRMPGMYVPAKKLHIFAGAVGLTKAEGQILIDADRAYIATIVAQPTRFDLVSDYHALIAAQESAYQRAHDRQDPHAMQIRLGFDAKIEAAAQTIRDYDIAHPEEAAVRDAERAESVERNRWV